VGWAPLPYQRFDFYTAQSGAGYLLLEVSNTKSILSIVRPRRFVWRSPIENTGTVAMFTSGTKTLVWHIACVQ
jgi:hypothetical protein